jgi:hypothetical protein
MSQSGPNGQFLETQYFDSTGGLNISDSPFRVKDTQATDGNNFEYTQTGGIQKRRGTAEINTVADTQLTSRGIDVFNTTLGVKTVIRCAGTKVQNLDIDTPLFTNLSQDTTAATTDVFTSTNVTNTVFAPFNTSAISLLNFAGATDGVYAVYSNAKYTRNGSTAPAGNYTATTIAGGGVWQTTGTYRYAVSYLKAATSAESNVFGGSVTLSVGVTTDVNATVAAVTNSVVLTFSSLTSIDTTTYNQMNIYRSSVNGSDDFTVGSLIATLTLPVTSYTDTGTSILDNENIPRANNVLLDNSTLPTGTYNVLCTWKRRLVTATGTTLRFSELNAPESWPTVNTIDIPSGGPITGVSVISFNTDFGNDEYLAVFKERELWLVRGNDYTDFTLSFIDTVGCANQSLIALSNGFLSWIDYRGIYLWNGSGKPIYTSRPIEPYFAIDGDLDKTQLIYGTSQYFRNRNIVCWYVSSKTHGIQKFVIKMDLRLTLPSITESLTSRVMDGVFVTDTSAQQIYSAKAYLPSTSQDEIMIVGDNAGKVYKAYQQFSDAGTGIDFQYTTPFYSLSTPNKSKRFTKVVAWVDATGSWDLTLDYWAGFRASLSQKSTLQAPITTAATNASALWDVAFWDLASWDDYTQSLVGVVFNLNNDQGNSEGDCIRLNFRNSGVDQPVTIYGYSIFSTEGGMNR